MLDYALSWTELFCSLATGKLTRAKSTYTTSVWRLLRNATSTTRVSLSDGVVPWLPRCHFLVSLYHVSVILIMYLIAYISFTACTSCVEVEKKCFSFEHLWANDQSDKCCHEASSGTITTEPVTSQIPGNSAGFCCRTVKSLKSS